MSRRNPNHQLAKIHRSYTVEEIARLYGVHRNTVRAWLGAGLPTIDKARPLLITGRDLGEFLRKRRKKNKRPCAASELYCLRCRAPRTPAQNQVICVLDTTTTGNLEGTCPICSLRMNKRVNLARLDAIRAELVVLLQKAPEHIDKSVGPSLNCAFNKETTPAINTTPRSAETTKALGCQVSSADAPRA